MAVEAARNLDVHVAAAVLGRKVAARLAYT
jgi:hypothetical protein